MKFVLFKYQVLTNFNLQKLTKKILYKLLLQYKYTNNTSEVKQTRR